MQVYNMFRRIVRSAVTRSFLQLLFNTLKRDLHAINYIYPTESKITI